MANQYQHGVMKKYSYTCPDRDNDETVTYVDRTRSDSGMDLVPTENKLLPKDLHAAPETLTEWESSPGDYPYFNLEDESVATGYVKLFTDANDNKIDTDKLWYFEHPDHGTVQVRFTNITHEASPRTFSEDESGDIKYDPAGGNDPLIPLQSVQWYDTDYDALDGVPGACGIVAECSGFGPALDETTSPCFQIWTTPEKGGDICCKTGSVDSDYNPSCDADNCYHTYACENDGCHRTDFVEGVPFTFSASPHAGWASSFDDCFLDGCSSKLNILWIKHKVTSCLPTGEPWTRGEETLAWGVLKGVTRDYYLDELTSFKEATPWTQTEKNKIDDEGTALLDVFSFGPEDCFAYEMYYGNDHALMEWLWIENQNWGISTTSSVKNDIDPNGVDPDQLSLYTMVDIQTDPDLWPDSCCPTAPTSTPRAAGDPHVTTFFGDKYDM